MCLFEALFKLFNDMYLNILGFPDNSAAKESDLQCSRQQFDSWVMKFPWRQDRLPLQYSLVSLVAQMVNNLPAIQETWVRSLGQEDLLENRMATHSSILAWRLPWTVEPDRL